MPLLPQEREQPLSYWFLQAYDFRVTRKKSRKRKAAGNKCVLNLGQLGDFVFLGVLFFARLKCTIWELCDHLLPSLTWQVCFKLFSDISLRFASVLHFRFSSLIFKIVDHRHRNRFFHFSTSLSPSTSFKFVWSKIRLNPLPLCNHLMNRRSKGKKII